MGLPKTNSADRLEPGESLYQVQHSNDVAVPPPYLNTQIICEFKTNHSTTFDKQVFNHDSLN